MIRSTWPAYSSRNAVSSSGRSSITSCPQAIVRVLTGVSIDLGAVDLGAVCGKRRRAEAQRQRRSAGPTGFRSKSRCQTPGPDVLKAKAKNAAIPRNANATR
jgi:hypothetical protein